MEIIVRREDGAGSDIRHRFEAERITIGRGRSNDLVLPDEARIVSNQHAEIRVSPSGYLLVDLDSTNATFLNGTRLKPRQPYPLREQDTVRIGPFSIVLSPERIASSSTTHVYSGGSLAELLGTQDAPLEKALEELVFLNELTREIGAARDVATVLRQVVERSVAAIRGEQGLITLVQEAEADEDERAARTFVRAGGSEPYRVNQDLLAWMRQHRKPLRLRNSPSDPTFRFFGWPPSLRSALCVPLIVRSELTGILSLFNSQSREGFSEEDQRLLTIIAGQSAQIIENARLVEEEKELLKMQQELRLVTRIQEQLLPAAPPLLPGYAVAGMSVPAEVVGGDYFDYIQISEREWGICVGDVSGKGLPASLVMANLQATLRAQAMWSASVEQCIERSNELLCRSTSRGTFATLFYGQLELGSHRFTWANAGHNRPYLLRANGQIASLKEGDLVLGFLPEQTYTARSLELEPGDAIVIYSDGVTECMNDRREEFGEDAFRDLLCSESHLAPDRLIERTLESLQAHAAGTPASDDITMVVLRREA